METPRRDGGAGKSRQGRSRSEDILALVMPILVASRLGGWKDDEAVASAYARALAYDHRTFEKNLNAFCEGGYISIVQRDAMNDILHVGHATMHRPFNPNEGDVSTALDITETFSLRFTYTAKRL